MRNEFISIILVTSAIVSTNTLAQARKHRAEYQTGFPDGISDGKHLNFYHNKLHDDQSGFDDYSNGYIDGWKKGCMKTGLSGDSCDASMDAGPN